MNTGGVVTKNLWSFYLPKPGVYQMNINVIVNSITVAGSQTAGNYLTLFVGTTNTSVSSSFPDTYMAYKTNFPSSSSNATQSQATTFLYTATTAGTKYVNATFSCGGTSAIYVLAGGSTYSIATYKGPLPPLFVSNQLIDAPVQFDTVSPVELLPVV
jgi:hypothetical protein